MNRCVQVTAPSRLHFGMFSFGQKDVRQYGGMGVMIEQPGIRVTLTRGDVFSVHGLHAERAAQFAQCVSAPWFQRELNCRIDVGAAPRQHIGLGTGTQLGLAIAAGLNALCGAAKLTPLELARAVGRGQRSAIGVHGFHHGGLLVEAGKLAAEKLSPLVCQASLPESWRFVLLTPRDAAGLWGDAERSAFDSLPPVAVQTTARLCQIVLLEVVPAAMSADFGAFSTGLFEFGRMAGACFAALQGGTYAGRSNERLVEQIRALGVTGVGQTSWGPTIFALLPSPAEADSLVATLRRDADLNHHDIGVAAPAKSGGHVLAKSD